MDSMVVVGGSVIQPLPSEEDIAAFEKGWRVHLPQDHRQFLKDNGGGLPVRKSFIAAGREWVVDRFLAIISDYHDNPLGDYDISVNLSQLNDRMGEDPDGLGAEMVPVAVLFAGDYICLDFRVKQLPEEAVPSVIIWLHEESEYLAPATLYVADSFTEFLALLR